MNPQIHPDGGSRAAGPLLTDDAAEPCAQCGVDWKQHPFGDGIETCSGDFPSQGEPLVSRSEEAAAELVIRVKIAALQAELRKQAEAGDTLGCDELHSQIGTLERTLAILAGEE